MRCLFHLPTLAVLVFFSCPGIAAAHGGGLDSNGCHNDRQNGGYHCHRAPEAAPQALLDQPPSGPRAYRNCAAARAAGAAPVRIGDPGYGVHLDRDRDGIGCE